MEYSAAYVDPPEDEALTSESFLRRLVVKQTLVGSLTLNRLSTNHRYIRSAIPKTQIIGKGKLKFQ